MPINFVLKRLNCYKWLHEELTAANVLYTRLRASDAGDFYAVRVVNRQLYNEVQSYVLQLPQEHPPRKVMSYGRHYYKSLRLFHQKSAALERAQESVDLQPADVATFVATHQRQDNSTVVATSLPQAIINAPSQTHLLF